MRVLIAEDENILAENIGTALKREDYDGLRFDTIDMARNGAVAIRLLKSEYDLVILDLKMPEVDGTQVIEALNLIEPPQKRPWVILITAYPGAYQTASIAIKMRVRALLQKPFHIPELLGVIRDLVRVRQQLFNNQVNGVVPHSKWILTFSDDRVGFVRTEGLVNFADSFASPWTRRDLLTYDRQADMAGDLSTTIEPMRHHWRFHAKVVGNDLFKKLFVGIVQESFYRAGYSIIQNHDLKISMAGPRDYLQLPLEFLNDGKDFLVLRHPMKRFISGVVSKGHIRLVDLTNRLQMQKKKLNILIIASNTEPNIPGVDEECAILHEWLKQILPEESYQVDFLSTEKATYDTVVRLLNGCKYHVIHYAGHGKHAKDTPGKSGLPLWEKENRQGGVKTLTVDAIKNALCVRGHELQFMFFSCCSSTTTSDERVLLDDDFLGIADGLIVNGIPAVLGYRWAVSDHGAKKMALAFYESLFASDSASDRDLDTALFHARCKVAGELGQETSDWLAPILIVQG